MADGEALPDPPPTGADHDADADATSRRDAARDRLADRHRRRQQDDDRARAAAATPLPDDAELVVYDPKYCIGCGFELSELPGDVTQCPRCGRGFEPTDPSTYADEPPPDLERNWWLQTPRLAGYGLLVLYVGGRIIIGWVAPSLGTGLSGGTGSGRVAGSIGALVSVLATMLLLPWILFGVLLGLASIEEYFSPKVGVTVVLGAGFGLLLTLGMHPAFLFIGLVAGGFAGLVYAWRQT